MRDALRLALAVLALAPGCAVRGAAERSVGWWRVAGDHAVTYGDIDPETTRQSAAALETIASTLEQLVPGCSDARMSPLDVVVLSHAQDYRAVTDEGGDASSIAERDSVMAAPAILVVRSAELIGSPAVIHRLAHRVIAACHPYVAAWVQEGLAAFFETMRTTEAGIEVGARPRWVEDRPDFHFMDFEGSHGRFFEDDAPPSPREIALHRIVPLQRNRIRDTRFAAAWLAVHAGILGDGFSRQRLVCALEGPRGAPCFAISSVRVLNDYAMQPLARTMMAASPPVTRAAPAEPIASTEMDLLWAFLLAPHRRSSIAEHLAFAAADSRTHARALLERIVVLQDAPEPILEDLAASQPESTLVLRALARRELERAPSPDGDALRIVDSLRARGDLAPDDLAEIAMLARVLGRHGEAEADARTAVARAPSDAVTRDALGFVLDLEQQQREGDRERAAAIALRAHRR